MMGVAIRAESSRGVSQINPGANLLEFFQSQVLPELQAGNPQDRPVVKATSIKFVATFRNQYTREQTVDLFPLLISHLSSPVVVVHTIAAYAIERILSSKDDGGQRKIGGKELQHFLEPLFTGLFTIIENKDINENDYAMKCVTRSLATVGPDVATVTEIVLKKLTEVLGRVARNPRNPQFNHYLFESIAVLVRNVCSTAPSATASFESLLFDPFNVVLQMGVEEFMPYVFQVLSQLLEYRPREAGLGDGYSQLLPSLMRGELWEKGKVPALARLLQAYLRQAGSSLVSHVKPILGIFQKLLAAGSTVEHSFTVLNSAVRYFSRESMDEHLPTIFNLIFRRLQEARSSKYVSHVANFFAVFIGKFGPERFVGVLEGIQKGLTMMVVKDVWAAHILDSDPAQRTQAKTQVVGLTKLLCDSSILLTDGSGDAAWAMGIVAAVKLIGSPTLKDSVEVGNPDDEKIEISYDSQFSQLLFARRPIDDPFPEVSDPKNDFCQSLNSLSAQQPGRLGALIQQGIGDNPKLHTAFQSLVETSAIRLA